MSRSIWKKSAFSPFLLKCLKNTLLKKKIKKKIFFARSSNIPSLFNKINLNIYNGNIFNKVLISEVMQKKKFGEFSISRKPFFFPKKKIKDKKR